ncbi:nucleic acid-binding protein [Tupanvirus deep ocean]|uniref:Nucleic acid-binding protein n=2 Tax=Tupanvirus TaxID=2094720 RepID=A0AC62A6N0_9VIRU|nr:nucleic acid-binding protein [Tupanvirus deep ocean]QKU33440.1 nucleic acid-binding protein [Tupanvirus deep ocean]
MPKNKGAGGKNRRKGKGTTTKTRELVYKDTDQEYGQITKSLGNGYMEVMCFTSNGNITKRAHIRGNMRKRVWMAAGDIVLVSVRDYQDTTCDIVMKYTSDEARLLRTRKQLPDGIDINKSDMVADEDAFTFDDVDDNDDKSDDDSKKSKVAKQNRNVEMPSSDSETDEDVDLDTL